MKSITIRGSGTRRLRSGGLWVYANEIADRLPGFEQGEMVRVIGSDGAPIGTGYVEPHSLIAFRLLRRGEGPIDRSFIVRRIREADELRRRFVRGGTYRLLFSEADRLPGVIIDRYGDLLTIQCLTWGADRIKPLIVESLKELYSPRALVVRNDDENRRALGLPVDDECLVFDETIDLSRHEVEIVGLSLLLDFTNAQKTGLYLDQMGTYETVKGIDFDELSGLDLFCYSGVFGMLALHRGAARVDFVDSSEAALDILSENLKRNAFRQERYNIVRSDVLQYVDSQPSQSRGFAFVDPPKFIKSRKSYYQGLQGYFNLNRAVVHTLADHGLLFTFSCSHHAGEAVFRKKVLDAIAKSGCSAREIYHFRQNADHASLLPMEESFYLKGLLLGIDRSKEDTI